MPRTSKKTTRTIDPNKKAKFKRGDVVTLIGLNGPDMLVTKILPMDDVDVDVTDDEDGFMVTVLYFNSRNELQGEYDGVHIPEVLLQLVRPANVLDQ